MHKEALSQGRLLLGLRKEQSAETRYNMDKPCRHDAKENKPTLDNSMY